MQNRQDIDGSQRPETTDAPDLDSGDHLGRGGDPVEGRDADAPAQVGAGGGGGAAGHLGAGGDPVEGDEAAINHDLGQTPAKE